MSGKVYSNTGAPSNADGVNGDIYMQLDGFKTTYRKEGGAWVAVGSTLGAIPEFISGVGVPSNVLGEDGQYYRNSANQDMYYKQGGTWALVGNLTGVAFQEVLVRAGIGKDLATPPNFINSGSLNTVIESGEYYYTNAVTNTPAPYGLMKVWRENASVIYQLVQTAGSGGRLYNRYSGDGGATWGSWVSYASTDLATTTLLGLVEKATQGELNTGVNDVWPDAETLLNGFSQNLTGKGSIRLPEWLGGFLIQWELEMSFSDPNTSRNVTFTFDLPFTSVLFACPTVLGDSNSLDVLGMYAGIYALNNTGLSIRVDESVPVTQVCKTGYMAIGK